MRASKNGRKTGSTTQDMTCPADPPPGPATPDENPQPSPDQTPQDTTPPGTGHASRARSHRRTYQCPQRVVAQALRHRPGRDVRSCMSALLRRRRRRRRLAERPTMRYDVGRALRHRPAPERWVGARLSRAQDVVGYVTSPAAIQRTDGPGCIFIHRRLRRELTHLPLVARSGGELSLRRKAPEMDAG
jgi:hypothetical protein